MAVRTASNVGLRFNQHRVDGLTREKVTLAALTTDIDNANDAVVVYQFPATAYLYDLSVLPADLDTHATPTLVFDVGIGDSDGVVDTVLISGSTGGQAGVRDDLDATVERLLDVGGKYLIFDPTTAAATAAAGNVAFAIVYDEGLDPLSVA